MSGRLEVDQTEVDQRLGHNSNWPPLMLSKIVHLMYGTYSRKLYSRGQVYRPPRTRRGIRILSTIEIQVLEKFPELQKDETSIGIASCCCRSPRALGSADLSVRRTKSLEKWACAIAPAYVTSEAPPQTIEVPG